MKTIMNFSVLFLVLTACNALPQLGQDIEEIATDNAVKIEINKNAIQNHEANIEMTVKVTNSQPDSK